jgi:hypothetical protein
MKGFPVKWMLFQGLMLFVLFCACRLEKSSETTDASRDEGAQEIVDLMVANYSDLVRLTIHGEPAGERAMKIIACNIKEKIGARSDPEDLEVLLTNEIVVLKGGDNLDVTAPIRGKDGKPIAATGITIRFREGKAEEDVVSRARIIAEEITSAVQKADGPLW